MKKQCKLALILCLFAMLLSVLSLTSIAEDIDSHVYTPSELSKIMTRSGNMLLETVKDDKTTAIKVTNDGIESPTGEYIVFDFYPSSESEAKFQPEFLIKDYPILVINYKTNINAGSMSINAGMKIDKANAYKRCWGLRIYGIKNDEKYHKAVYDLSKFGDFDGGSAKWDNVTADSGIKYLRIPIWAHSNGIANAKGEYINIEYIGFFKTAKDAEKYVYTGDKLPANVEVVGDKRTDKPFIKGYDGYKFKPENNMTRAEAVTVVLRLIADEAAIKGQNTSTFTDVKSGDWYYDNIAYLEAKGYLKSYSGEFKPNQQITRAEFVELVVNALGIKAKETKEIKFSDVDASHPKYDSIVVSASAGLVGGYPDGTFKPDNTIKRSEVVKVLCGALGRTPTLDSFKNLSVVGFADVAKTHWAYPYIIESAYEHETNVAKAGNEMWLSLVDEQEYLKEMPDGLIEELDEKFAERVKAIKASESEYTVKPGARVYYVSNDGDDNNDGRSPETPLKTLLKVEQKIAAQSIKNGNVVLLRRGDEWHHQLTIKAGITISAYGEGPKPRILGSIEADNADQWILTDAENVYKFHKSITAEKDVGNIVFNDGEAFGQRIIKDANGKSMAVGLDNLASNGKTYWNFPPRAFADYKALAQVGADIPEADLMFYHDREGSELYLYCREGNPGDIFESIELCQKGNAIDLHAHNFTIDNVQFGYTGSHGLGTGSYKNLTVRNCEICWIGGSVQGNDVKVRFGNAVEIYGQADGFYVYNNHIYQCFDCGPTVQVSATLTEGKQIYQKNVEFYGNALAEASLEVWMLTSPKNTETTFAKVVNCKIYDNYGTMSGYGFKGYNHTTNRDPCSFYGGGNTGAEYIDCYIENNYFWNIRKHLLKANRTQTAEGVGFVWRNNVIIKEKDSFLGHMGSDLIQGTGYGVYKYNEDTIKKMLSTGAFGFNQFYYIPDGYDYEIDKNPDFGGKYN